MSDDIRQNALSFEAVKVSMNQDKNGIILRLNVHPNDCPKELHTDWVGTRYMVAMVRLNEGVRNYCNIKSRTEFRDNVSARDKFVILRDDFKAWKRG